MTVKILIKRKVSDDILPGLDFLLRKLRALTVVQPGYISGESFKRIDVDGWSLVISTWQTIDDWRRWSSTPERIELQNEIDILLGEATEYEAYQNY